MISAKLSDISRFQQTGPKNNKVLFSSPKNQKLFKISRHIESYGTCMEY